MKIKAILLSLVLGATLLVGCGAKEEAKPATADVVTTASLVTEPAAFEKAVSKDGGWFVQILKDITFEKEIIVEGEFTKADKEDATKKVPAGRKLALYERDDKKVTTATHTLTAPKLIIKTKDCMIQGGTFVGDVYVEAEGFSVKNGKVQGNVYFATEELKTGFKLSEGGSITGAQEVKK